MADATANLIYAQALEVIAEQRRIDAENTRAVNARIDKLTDVLVSQNNQVMSVLLALAAPMTGQAFTSTPLPAPTPGASSGGHSDALSAVPPVNNPMAPIAYGFDEGGPFIPPGNIE